MIISRTSAVLIAMTAACEHVSAQLTISRHQFLETLPCSAAQGRTKKLTHFAGERLLRFLREIDGTSRRCFPSKVPR
jgi:hypothetical protein